MKRFAAFLSLALSACGWLRAAETTSNITITTEPAGAAYYVDGKLYTGPSSFLWPTGSKHTLFVETPQWNAASNRRMLFQGWSDTAGRLNSASTVLVITADSSITTIRAVFSTEYLLGLRFFQCTESPGSPCHPPGTVSVSGASYVSDADIWLPANSRVVLMATPSPGFVFGGWGGPLYDVTTFITTLTLNNSVILTPLFAPAKRVRITATPPDLGLEVIIDRQPVPTPIDFDWAEGSRHVLGAADWQTDRWGKLWAFESWSNGTALHGLYVARQANITETINAVFVPGARASFVTVPTGLKLRIDGRENWTAYNFVWGVNSRHEVSAPLEQTDSTGRKFVFKGWSNGGAASQEVTVPVEAAATGYRLVATFEGQGRLNIRSNIPGVSVSVDGTECRTPCTVDRPGGSSVRLAAQQSVPLSDTARMEFHSWSDGAGRERGWTFGADTATLTLNYRTSYLLATGAEPAGGAAIRCEPQSADGYYPAGSQVALLAETRPGFKFQRWEGDLTGTYKAGSLSMEGPRAAMAVLARTPYIATAGVRNAAAETPDAAVAPGSLISVMGASLASAYTAGPASPLAQTIGGVTVRVGDRLLPLLFVSPEQINAQLPSDLPVGRYRLTVRAESLGEVTADFEAVRNAPGLFVREGESRPFAVASHEDGSPVTLDSPARRGETVSLFGTGFGPLSRPVPDGFAVPETPQSPLADTVELAAGEAVLPAAWAGAVPGMIGTQVVRFRIGDELPGSVTIEIRARVNGRASNAVLLPLE